MGPFTLEALGKMQRAGLINEDTPIRPSDDAPWVPLGKIQGAEAAKPAYVERGTPTSESFYYVDANGQTTGPASKEQLLALRTAGAINATTLITRRGDASWITLGEVLGTARQFTGQAIPVPADQEFQPVRRSLQDFMVLMGATLTLYTFYVVPSYSKDLRIITGKERIQYKPLLILGIVTLSFALIVLLVAWAYDLEKYGRTKQTPGRQEALGAYVLALNVVSVLSLFWSGWIALIIGLVAGVWSVWLVQNEINLYAPPAA